MMNKKIYLYPVWVRSWHTINAVLFLILIATGIAMQYANPDNEIVLISFGKAVKWHNVAAIILTFNYGFYILGNIFTGNGKYYIKWRKNLWSNLWKQFVYYSVGMFRKDPHPFPVTEKQKFNPLQKFAYVIVMYFCMPLLIFSGLGLLFPEIIDYNVFNLSGIIFYDLLHIIVGFILSVFLVVHIYTCTLGDRPGTLFKSMITGYHEEHE